MDNESVVEQIVRSLSFEVEAVPDDKNVQLTGTSKSTPLNVKIRVRKKNDSEFQHNLLALPKIGPNAVPQRIRLVSSDQTIISFRVIMENEDKSTRNPRNNLVPNVCLGMQPDEENYAYMPGVTYDANVNQECTENRSDNTLRNKFTLSKVENQNMSPKVAKKNKDVFGKCKPGGCLDPPFGEDKYSYQPQEKKFPTPTPDTNTTKTSSIFSNKIFKKKKKSKSDQNTDTVKIDDDSIVDLYQAGSLQTSTTYSNSIMTYPPTTSSSTQRLQEEKPKNIPRHSVNDGNCSFYILSRKDRNIIDTDDTNLQNVLNTKPSDQDSYVENKPVQQTTELSSNIKESFQSNLSEFNQKIQNTDKDSLTKENIILTEGDPINVVNIKSKKDSSNVSLNKEEQFLFSPESKQDNKNVLKSTAIGAACVTGAGAALFVAVNKNISGTPRRIETKISSHENILQSEQIIEKDNPAQEININASNTIVNTESENQNNGTNLEAQSKTSMEAIQNENKQFMNLDKKSVESLSVPLDMLENNALTSIVTEVNTDENQKEYDTDPQKHDILKVNSLLENTGKEPENILILENNLATETQETSLSDIKDLFTDFTENYKINLDNNEIESINKKKSENYVTDPPNINILRTNDFATERDEKTTISDENESNGYKIINEDEIYQPPEDIIYKDNRILSKVEKTLYDIDIVNSDKNNTSSNVEGIETEQVISAPENEDDEDILETNKEKSDMELNTIDTSLGKGYSDITSDTCDINPIIQITPSNQSTTNIDIFYGESQKSIISKQLKKDKLQDIWKSTAKPIESESLLNIKNKKNLLNDENLQPDIKEDKTFNEYNEITELYNEINNDKEKIPEYMDINETDMEKVPLVINNTNHKELEFKTSVNYHISNDEVLDFPTTEMECISQPSTYPNKEDIPRISSGHKKSKFIDELVINDNEVTDNYSTKQKEIKSTSLFNETEKNVLTDNYESKQSIIKNAIGDIQLFKNTNEEHSMLLKEKKENSTPADTINKNIIDIPSKKLNEAQKVNENYVSPKPNQKLIKIDIGFQTFVNENNERVIKSFNTDKQNERPVNSVIITKSYLKEPFEIKIPTDSEHCLNLKFKKTAPLTDIPKKTKGTQTKSSSLEQQKQKRILIQETCDVKINDKNNNNIQDSLNSIYKAYEELIPLKNTMSKLKHDIAQLAVQQTSLRERSVNKKIKRNRSIQFTKRCSCMRKF